MRNSHSGITRFDVKNTLPMNASFIQKTNPQAKFSDTQLRPHPLFARLAWKTRTTHIQTHFIITELWNRRKTNIVEYIYPMRIYITPYLLGSGLFSLFCLAERFSTFACRFAVIFSQKISITSTHASFPTSLYPQCDFDGWVSIRVIYVCEFLWFSYGRQVCVLSVSEDGK